MAKKQPKTIWIVGWHGDGDLNSGFEVISRSNGKYIPIEKSYGRFTGRRRPKAMRAELTGCYGFERAQGCIATYDTLTGIAGDLIRALRGYVLIPCGHNHQYRPAMPSDIAAEWLPDEQMADPNVLAATVASINESITILIKHKWLQTKTWPQTRAAQKKRDKEIVEYYLRSHSKNNKGATKAPSERLEGDSAYVIHTNHINHNNINQPPNPLQGEGGGLVLRDEEENVITTQPSETLLLEIGVNPKKARSLALNHDAAKVAMWIECAKELHGAGEISQSIPAYVAAALHAGWEFPTKRLEKVRAGQDAKAKKQQAELQAKEYCDQQAANKATWASVPNDQRAAVVEAAKTRLWTLRPTLKRYPVPRVELIGEDPMWCGVCAKEWHEMQNAAPATAEG